MTRTVAILLAIAASWAAIWGVAGYFMHGAGGDQMTQAEHVRTLATRVERGAEVRFEATIADGPKTRAPYSERECLAASAVISVTGGYRDARNRWVRTSSAIAVRRSGPATIGIMFAGRRIELPSERWVPHDTTSAELREVPARLGVTQAEIDAARAQLRGAAQGYSVSEATLDAGARVFVVAKIEDRDGPPHLEADPRFSQVVLFPGSHDEYTRKLRGSGGGLKTAGWILGAGVGPLPLAIIGLVLLLRARKRAAVTGARDATVA